MRVFAENRSRFVLIQRGKQRLNTNRSSREYSLRIPPLQLSRRVLTLDLPQCRRYRRFRVTCFALTVAAVHFRRCCQPQSSGVYLRNYICSERSRGRFTAFIHRLIPSGYTRCVWGDSSVLRDREVDMPILRDCLPLSDV